MLVSFMTALPEKKVDSTDWMKALPRPMRKTLRLTKPRIKNLNTHDGVEDYMAMGYRTDAYHNQNLVETDPLHDEFGDIDNEYEGLTIVDSMTEVELFEFCTGYNTL